MITMENYYKSIDWSQIEKDFIEWDNEGHSNASQRDILNWLKERFTPVTVLPGRGRIIEVVNSVYDEWLTAVTTKSLGESIADELSGQEGEDTSVNFVQARDLTDEEWLHLPKEELLKVIKG